MAILVLPLCSAAVATANPPPSQATTTVFQVPVRFVVGCLGSTFPCWNLPPVTTVSPSATMGPPGVVTFATEPAANWAYCVDVMVNWRNLSTGVVGTAALQIVERDYTRPIAPEDWCRYAPATAITGRGTVVAVADVDTVVPYGLWGYKMLVHPGLGNFEVP
ncbi:MULTISPECIES: hypothetical protein [unclassified Rhodococcus (in: high G+C Gram-positive bacteria)]|uniref:hypothetical protein n=1 Tax=unclassified Rhodococcus (in: high G+C Gram-positive bacteria) TaxID=192944 RepID=UPI0028A1A3A1|nr:MULTISPECIES: hypothetical protein [unclassified Rhodococcus (in: high G+C Gram-positive bacteria)]